jgi:hypothetical protein
VYSAMPGGAYSSSNMNSIGGGPVRSTVGQGAPARVAPRQAPSTITGTK